MNRFCIPFLIFSIFYSVAVADDAPDAKNFTCISETNKTLFEQVTFDFSLLKINVPESNKHLVNEERTVKDFTKTCHISAQGEQHFRMSINGNESLLFEFGSPAKDDAHYILNKIIYEKKDQASNSTLHFENDGALDLKVPENKFRKESDGYTCESNKFALHQMLKVNSTENATTVELELVNFKFVAFQKDGRANSIECKDQSGSPVVPLAVGGGLCILMAVTLGIYIVVRQRSK